MEPVAFLLFVVVAIVALAAVPTVVAMLRVVRRWSIERRSPVALTEARVVDKRVHVMGGAQGPTDQRYYVTFQFPDGNRRELEVSGPEAGLLVVGDEGTLHWRGPRYLGFVREILR